MARIRRIDGIQQRDKEDERSLSYVEALYAILYLTLLIAGTAFVTWYELTQRVPEHNATADVVYALILGIGYVGLADAAITVGFIEGGIAIMFLARMMMERAERRGVLEGIEQGMEQGLKEGLKEGKEAGREENQRKWEAWNYRRLQAQEEGRDFNEPPPSLDDE